MPETRGAVAQAIGEVESTSQPRSLAVRRSPRGNNTTTTTSTILVKATTPVKGKRVSSSRRLTPPKHATGVVRSNPARRARTSPTKAVMEKRIKSPPPRRLNAWSRKRAAEDNAKQSPMKRSKTSSTKAVNGEQAQLVLVGSAVSQFINLPFNILSQIFEYASQSYGTKSKRENSAWLVEIATTCRVFQEPALATLYRNPPLLVSAKVRKFIEILHDKPELARLVQQIETLPLVFDKNSKTDVREIIKLTPNVKHFFTTAHIDTEDVFKRGSSTTLFSKEFLLAFEETGQKLKSWIWDGSYCRDIYKAGPYREYESSEQAASFLANIHTFHPSFASLTELHFINIQPDPGRTAWAKAKQTDFYELMEDNILESLLPLTKLRHLYITDCDFVSDRFLTAMPCNLATLSIKSINPLTAQGVTDYLAQHGESLKSLTLERCPGVDLGFLAGLAQCTPNLLELRYHPNGTITEIDGRTIFDSSTIITWPSFLRTISMRALEFAETNHCILFLESLIENAKMGNFTHLRHLNLWCILESLEWRQRAAFRSEWHHAIMTTFLDPKSDQYKDMKSELPRNVKSTRPRGYCSRVSCRVDSARPTGEELTENDFYDFEKRNNLVGVKKSPAKSKTASRKPNGATSKQTPARKVTANGRNRALGATNYEDDDDEDFEADELAYIDEDGVASDWSDNEGYDGPVLGHRNIL